MTWCSVLSVSHTICTKGMRDMTLLEALRCGLALWRLSRAGKKPLVRRASRHRQEVLWGHLKFMESRCGDGWVVYDRHRPFFAPKLLDALHAAERGDPTC